MDRVRVLLADDHELARERIRDILQPRYEIVHEVGNGVALVDAASRFKPDLVILDDLMPFLNGIEAASHIRKHHANVKLLFLTTHWSNHSLAAALNSGATGYVMKTAVPEDLLRAVARVMDGLVYISSGLGDEHPEPRSAAPGYFKLSASEREVLQLIAEGRAMREISSFLGISVRAVCLHRENIQRKLGTASTAELTRHAIAQGLI